MTKKIKKDKKSPKIGTIGRNTPFKKVLDVKIRLIEASKTGSSDISVCAYAGIHRDSYRQFKNHAKELETAKTPLSEHDTKLLKCYKEIQQAKEELELFALNCIRNAAPKDWRAAKALLELTKPKQFIPTLNIGVENKDIEIILPKELKKPHED